jgi:serine/threonine protein kinase
MSALFLGTTVDGPSGAETLRVERLLGSGAFGSVFLARDTASGAEYAVKCPHTVMLGSDELTAFRNELRIAGRIDHPNVTRVAFAAADADPPYLVMEYLTGGTLEDRLDRCQQAGGVPLDLVRRWSMELVDGIAAINAQFLHRDLKPDNVLMAGDSTKINDFGLSKVVGAATRSQTFKGFGALLYMPPEGWDRETNEIQYDMYSMGIVLFQVATTQYPYDKPQNPQTGAARMHRFQAPKELRQFRGDLPAGFQQLLTRLLQKRPTDRYPNWDQAKEALRTCWQSPILPGGQRDRIEELLQKVSGRHAAEERSALDRDKAFHERQEREEYMEYMRDRLLDSLRQVIDEFNARSSLGQITLNRTERGECLYTVPGGKELKLVFFRCSPPRPVTGGAVEFAAGLAPSPYRTDQCSVTFILVVTPEDPYGQWKAIRKEGVGAALDPAELGGVLRSYSEPYEGATHAFLAALECAMGGV